MEKTKKALDEMFADFICDFAQGVCEVKFKKVLQNSLAAFIASIIIVQPIGIDNIKFALFYALMAFLYGALKSKGGKRKDIRLKNLSNDELKVLYNRTCGMSLPNDYTRNRTKTEEIAYFVGFFVVID